MLPFWFKLNELIFIKKPVSVGDQGGKDPR